VNDDDDDLIEQRTSRVDVLVPSYAISSQHNFVLPNNQNLCVPLRSD
jgi:hypothetical protein